MKCQQRDLKTVCKLTKEFGSTWSINLKIILNSQFDMKPQKLPFDFLKLFIATFNCNVIS